MIGVFDGRKKLIIDGWNDGLSGGELAARHGCTRSAIAGIIGRARLKGVIVEVRNKHPTAGTMARIKQAQERKPVEPGPSMPSFTIQRPSLPAVKTRQFPQPKPELPVIIGIDLAAPGGDFTACWLPLMDLQDNAGCRYSHDAKLFCNAPGFPYCPEHKAIVNPPEAQRGGFKKLAKNYGGWE